MKFTEETLEQAVVELFEAQHHRAHGAAHRHAPVAHDDAPVDEVDLDAVGRCQRELLHLLAVERTERLDRHHDASPMSSGRRV